MAAAIGPIAGIGSSIIGGIQGKGAAKRQEKEAERLRQMLAPLVNQQVQGLQFAQQQGQQLFPQATNALNMVFNSATGAFEPLMTDYRQMLKEATSSQGRLNQQGDELMGLGQGMIGKGQGILDAGLANMMGASVGLGDLKNFYRDFMYDGQRAIDKFLPGQQQLNKLMAGDFANVNQGFKSASQNIEAFGPRGGGRVSSLANADVDRQRQLTQMGAQGRQSLLQTNLNNAFQGAQGTQGVLAALAQLGQGQGQLGLSQGQLGLGTIGAGQQNKQLGIQEFGAKSGAGLQQLQAALQALGLGGQAASGLGQLAGSTLNLGTQGGGNIFDMFNQQMNRAYGSAPQQSSSKGLGGFLVDLFNTPKTQDWMSGIFGGGKKTAGAGLPGTMPSQKF